MSKYDRSMSIDAKEWRRRTQDMTQKSPEDFDAKDNITRRYSTRSREQNTSRSKETKADMTETNLRKKCDEYYELKSMSMNNCDVQKGFENTRSKHVSV